ncbi:similar to Saccharomyces cerevisiae YBR175W SWD3 Essential subunit of the COMPASS (Set1C) complex [Maudiozyma barnettii]|uniref:Similar to Saccharomyces cerevisiae YBR175W SWD3 Essential subunit of the COMPASS (Set1C) complex n=1 Tax=Maudiozyma barnettii TaxID=61262 RepID=A0A8H2VEJ8_9SACH|nr:Swd3p [Kazachstania barnettii]CAB4253664.1 similar to Saccharomyces cerevisiae YBR175W SWD3 Essential subunit of the COMPASS (Set1C) complex [Kazachstania barnettii]CAD1781362.1 similar to Saccharomyces cerevisiae YBR175W SWD3 Essential subunit of the COMPASS (Set1C) complex [Kazachstania barnettii]
MYEHVSTLHEPHSDRKSTYSTVKVSPNGQCVAIPQDTHILIYDITNDHAPPPPATRIVTNHTLPISDVCWSPDGECIATASDDHTVEIVHVTMYGILHILTGHTAPVVTLCYNSKGNLLFTGSMDESVKTWDVLNGKCLRTISAHSDSVVSLTLPHCDDSVMASGSYDGLVRIFDTQTGHCLSTLTYDKDWKHSGRVVPITQLEFSLNGKFLLVKSLDGAVKLWDCIRGVVVRTFVNRQDDNNSNDATNEWRGKFSGGMAIGYIDPPETHSNGIVISGDSNGYISCWDTHTKRLLQKMDTEQRNPIMDMCTVRNKLAVITRDGRCDIYKWGAEQKCDEPSKNI